MARIEDAPAHHLVDVVEQVIAAIVQVHAHHSERNDARAILRHGLVDGRELVQVLEAVERQRLPLFLRRSLLIVRPVTSLRVLRQLVFRLFFLISIRLLLLLWRWGGLLALSLFVRIVIIAVVGVIVRGHLTPLVRALKESSGAGVRVDAKVLELSSSQRHPLFNDSQAIAR